MVGCRHNAKNTLVKNYLYFAEKGGVEVRADTEVSNVTPLQGAGYQVDARVPGRLIGGASHYTAKNVIFAAGVIGTVRLLLNCRNMTKTLPNLSHTLGHSVRTNSESILGVRIESPAEPMSSGVAIAASVHPDPYTSIEAVRYPAGSDAIGLLVAPLAAGATVWGRLARLIMVIAKNPLKIARIWFPWRFAIESVIILVMQSVDSTMRFRLARRFSWPTRTKLVADFGGSQKPPTLLPQGVEFVKKAAELSGGTYASSISEILGIPLTAHILGGCPMGETAASGVIDHAHRIHNYPGLYVLGGAAIPDNLGVNPSLTITAMAERAMAMIPKAVVG